MAKGLPDFQIPINITAQTLEKLAVDIAAQTIGNLGVNIKAQDLALLKADIVAQTLAALDINITAQDLAQLVIKIAAQTVGVYLQPEWAALQGVDKNFRAASSSVLAGGGISATYTVPAGKTLYITQAGFSINAVASANADHNQIGDMSLRDQTSGIDKMTAGGNGGAFASFPRPLIIPASKVMKLIANNFSDHTCSLEVQCHGYEI